MEWRLSGQAQTLAIQFLVDGQFAVPDASSIFLTVRGNDGAPLTGYNHVAQSNSTTTQSLVSLPSDINTIDPSATFEARYARLDFAVGGKPYFAEVAYRLYAFVPITTTGEKVRSLIGVDFEELPDRDIEILPAYFELLGQLGDTFKTALTSTGLKSLAANDAIALQSAISLCHTFPVRVLQSEAQDNASFDRPDIDFDKLENALRVQLGAKIATVLGDQAVDAAIIPVLFSVTSQTDVITNT